MFVNHVARHMEQIALLALPRAAEESDDEAERDGSESLADTTSSSDALKKALKPGPLEDRDDWTLSTNEKKKELLRSPSPSHIERPANPVRKFMAQSKVHFSWSPEHDELLMQARRQGLHWQRIASMYFPNKTANACRKRHERLMEKRNKADQEENFDSDAATVGSIGRWTLPYQTEGAIDQPHPISRTDVNVGRPIEQASPPAPSIQSPLAPPSLESLEEASTNLSHSVLKVDRTKGNLAHIKIHESKSLENYGRPVASNTKHVKKGRQRTTPEEATHACHICGKLFKRAYNWKSHMETHDAERRYPHPCTAMVDDQPCAKKFQREADLDKHIDLVRLSLIDV